MDEDYLALALATPTDALNDGCPTLTKDRALVSPVGQSTVVQWDLRKQDGTPMDISSIIAQCASDASSDSSESSDSSDSSACPDPECGSVVVRFAQALCPGDVYEVAATIVDAATGRVQVAIPEIVRNYASIYQMNFGVYGPNGALLSINKGLLSIEPSLFGDIGVKGPPTLNEIRLQARDSLGDNSLLDGVEFSDAEIVYSMLRPVQEFNSASPPLNIFFSPRTFPYHYQWVNATVANLLRIAAHNYMRNKLLANHGGVTVNNKDRDQPYLQLALALSAEWKQFVQDKKVELNYAQCVGYIGSPYGDECI